MYETAHIDTEMISVILLLVDAPYSGPMNTNLEMLYELVSSCTYSSINNFIGEHVGQQEPTLSLSLRQQADAQYVIRFLMRVMGTCHSEIDQHISLIKLK